MHKIKLTLKQNNGFAPRYVELDKENIYLNNVILPKHIDPDAGYNPHDVKLYAIGNEYGALCAIWASHAQEAFDEACNHNAIDCLMAEDQNYEDETLTHLGNAGELFDLSYAWIGEVEFDAAKDVQLIVLIVRGAENQQTTLEA